MAGIDGVFHLYFFVVFLDSELVFSDVQLSPTDLALYFQRGIELSYFSAAARLPQLGQPSLDKLTFQLSRV